MVKTWHQNVNYNQLDTKTFRTMTTRRSKAREFGPENMRMHKNNKNRIHVSVHILPITKKKRFRFHLPQINLNPCVKI